MEVPKAERESLERFSRLVLADRELHNQLRATTTEAEFAAVAARLGAERGCAFAPPTVVAAIREKRRALLERWL
jgi:hypothetical protein